MNTQEFIDKWTDHPGEMAVMARDIEAMVADRMAALQAENARLRASLRPFAYLWRDALLDKPDLAPVYSFNDAVITVGHLKAARRELGNQT